MDSDTVIDDYLNWKTGKASISPEWEKNTRNLLTQFVRVLDVPVGKCSTKDVFRAFKIIRESDKYKPNYKRQLISASKAFCQWVAKTNKKIELSEVAEVKLPTAQWKTKKPEDMLTVEEVETVIQVARNARDKALIAMLYDGSNRPIEKRTEQNRACPKKGTQDQGFAG